jgi:uncharacterized lipoprotein YddW (UPF0748 family)
MQFAHSRAALALCAAMTLAVPALAGGAAQPQPTEVVRLARVSLDSADSIRRAVASAAAQGATTLLVPVLLGPRLEPFDPLAAVLREARERGLRVRAWVQVNVAAPRGELPAARDHVLYRHPDWLMVPRELAPQMLTLDVRSPEYIGRLARWARAQADRASAVYVSPLHPEAAAYIATAVRDLAATYELDGVHFDGLQLPGDDFDYSRTAIDRFRGEMRARLTAAERTRLDEIEAIDPFAYAEEFPEEWRRFRDTRVAELVLKLRAAVESARPSAAISAEAMADPALARMTH